MPAKKPVSKKIASKLSPGTPPVVPAAPVTVNASSREVPEENIEEIFEHDADDSALERKNTALFVAGIIGAVALTVASVVIFTIYLRSPKVTVQETAMDSEAPVITPTPTFAPATVTLEVLNGSGVAGAAAKAAAQLSEKGFAVIGTGNAPKTTNTRLFVKNTLTGTALESLLSQTQLLFGVASPSGDLEGSSVSARLVIGVLAH